LVFSHRHEASAIVVESREATVTRDPQRAARTSQDVLNVVAGSSVAGRDVGELCAVGSHETSIGSYPKRTVAILLNHLDRATGDSKLFRHISEPVVLQPTDSLQRTNPHTAQTIFV